ncbi:MAG TPA: RNA-binding protein [Rhizomicrobium sp.]|nr:RNA-binding protein [Rhizomicrobium sp.]
MTATAAIREEDGALRERRCIVTGEVLPEARLIRFVEGPDGCVVPDIAAKLPGRGMWVSAERAILERAITKNHFSKAAKKPLSASPDLPDRVEKLIVQRMADDLGLARRAGGLILGFDQIANAFQSKTPPLVLVEASDGGADGKRKLFGVAWAQGLKPRVIDCLNCAELSLALGRENVVHAALKSGQLAERLELNAGRLAGFRMAGGEKIDTAGTMPAADERHE